MIDPVAADVIGRQDRAGHLRPLQTPICGVGGPSVARRSVLHSRWRRAAARHVGVALGQLEGGRAAQRPAHRGHPTAGAEKTRALSARPRSIRGTTTAAGNVSRELVGLLCGDLGADELHGLERVGAAWRRRPPGAASVRRGRRRTGPPAPRQSPAPLRPAGQRPARSGDPRGDRVDRAPWPRAVAVGGATASSSWRKRPAREASTPSASRPWARRAARAGAPARPGSRPPARGRARARR